MNIFRRSMSFGSSHSSRPSTIDSASDTASSRTSIDSTFEEYEITDSLATIKPSPPSPKAPVLTLPLELIQQVNSYLDTASAAAFCLSGRYIYYALGTEVLSRHVKGSKNRFEKRKIIEAVVERAFPGHWFCGWCDKFHAWAAEDGPKNQQYSRKRRDCADFNSYLDAGDGYKLRFHHVRLAINRASRGDEHGIPLSAFTYEKKDMARISRTPVPTKLTVSARIVNGRFLLHSSYAIVLPAFTTRNRNLLKTLWPLLPHIVTGHRDTPNGHTGIMAAIDNVIRRGWKYQFTQNCSTCATDWSVTSQDFSHATGGQVRLVVQSWRDLGTGRTPFETGWRAHGVGSCAEGSGANTCLVRLTSRPAGSVRRAFEAADVDEGKKEVTHTGAVAASTAPKSRIYRSFMRRNTSEEGPDEIRRSSARPRYWRTREENEAVARKYAEDTRDVARDVAEELIRLDARRGNRAF
ncbi:hypothetical protein J4E93_005245 [Alternaria ventricosa]|uniref:uncharacterized protein n=1 Tax=Alternaria ventricosa TaxID=1187951 RepID=UPI0020C5145B|nr:uncharacterized protein J4E93_005245 [Alternaria ventricosa]KAI4645668.1 hypothetical protein J4E93_005245 [Alternaria ventricosa]